MNIIIQSVHFTSKPVLNAFITDKLNSLLHLYDKIESANVFLKIEKSDTAADKHCEIRLIAPGHDLFIKKESATFEEAVAHSVDALHEQITRAKSKHEHQ